MKKYICLIITIALAVLSTKFGWLLSGNEAVAATQQVFSGDDYIVGRTSQEVWSTVKTLTEVGALSFMAITIYLFTTKQK